jgi:competence protein ComEA
VARRLALVLACALTLVPSAWRVVAARPQPAPACAPEGRGVPPRHWIGCAGDPGPPRDLTGQERVLLGLPVDLDRASAEDLAAVPGLSARLGAEIVADRARRGRFASPDDLIRVRGIGPARLARARPFLATGR